jgi:hypothetical protein
MALYVLGYLGEMRSVLRHVMEGVVPIRLALWFLLAVLADSLLSLPVPKTNSKIE